ncbi:hypothetical protein EOS_15460 [Caballeronia mineralivorans PML1(12)]|uniref:Uncharacterized protein n=1 Tax=Caballeronia mineralivorans PML1(12) TaxID=908627 RepID=A0A0J1FZM0_9BURK|nr:hypothetical protein [Caballeronia mineralivorans]KLU25388.1 hypothetical protein EOS_15460 [Caballeronia mineralivorans PML1(12)]
MIDGQLISLILTLTVAGGGAYLGSYLREKGKSLATKEDIGKITAIVEEVKTEIGQRDWAQREWTQLRRAKLEELLNHVHGVGRYISSQSQKAKHGEPPSDDDPSAEVQTLMALYFPELQPEVFQFLEQSSGVLLAIANLGQQFASAGGDPKARAIFFDSYLANKDHVSYMRATDALRARARSLLVEIMPLAAQPSDFKE